MATEPNPRVDARHQIDRKRFWEWDLTNDTVYYSRDWKRSRGCEDGDMLRTPCLADQYVHPDDRVERQDLIKRLRTGEKEQFRFEHRVKINDGSWRHVVEEASTGCNSEGQSIRIICCEFELLDADKNQIFQKSHSPILDVDSLPVAIARFKNDQCIYVNDFWSRLTGRSLESALGTGWMEFIHRDDFKFLAEKKAAFVEDKNQVLLDAAEVRYVLSDGSSKWVQCHLAKELDDDGNVTGYIGILNDTDRLKCAEEELRELNLRLHAVLEFCSIGIWNWCCEEERLFWDEEMLKIYGVAPEDFRGTYEDWSDRIHPDDRDRILKEDLCRRDSKSFLTTEYRIVRPNGDVRYVYACVFFEFNEYGKPVRTTGVNVDVTQRREAESALLDSENKFQRIANQLPGIVYRYFLDPDGNSGWTYLSSQVRELFGFEPSELLDDRGLLWALIEPSDMSRLADRMNESARDLTRFVEEFRIINSEGACRWYQATSQPQKGRNGRVVWDGVILEITDRKNAVVELQEAKHQLERITENVLGMIYQYVLRSDGTYEATFISSQCRELFGLTSEEIIGDVNLLFSKLHSGDIKRMHKAVLESARTLQPLKVEFRVSLPGKGVRWHQTMGQPIKNGDHETVFNGMVLDITDRKEAELVNDVLAKATKTKDEFLANMSHELRTPLTAILAMTDGLQQGMFGDTTPKQMESLKIVEQSGEHLLDLINEVLDLAKIESGQMELEFSGINVSELCESCLNFVTQQAEQKQIELSLKVPWNLPKLESDEKRIRQVLINLLSNAVKFTPEGGKVKLEVETLAAELGSASETLRILVSDNGIGIQVDQLDSLFEPFVQVDSSLTRQHGGTGLGLSLAKQFVELHEGKIYVSSEPGQGSCFTVDLPFRKGVLSQSKQAESKQVKEQRTLGNSNAAWNLNSDGPHESEGSCLPLVLVVEDNDEVALSLTPILEFSKFRVMRAGNGKLALEMAQEYLPDLILMDVQMPVMDGLEATRQIRAIRELSQLPIIGMSGFAKPEDSHRCIAAGASLFMTKPLRAKELVGNINSLLQGYRQLSN